MDGEPEDPRLSRLVPDDWQHVEKYPLSAVSSTVPKKVPVVLGINWYTEMDHPKKDAKSGDYFLVGAKKLTKIRGGHCVCLEPGGQPDKDAWWKFYDQGAEGACVGFGWSRCMTILNGGEHYAARWLWDRAKETDEWPETEPGDDARATCTAARSDGIVRYRWATSVDQVHLMLQNGKANRLGAVPVLNSWGTNYPHRVWMPDDVLARLIKEDGEVAIPTDR